MNHQFHRVLEKNQNQRTAGSGFFYKKNPQRTIKLHVKDNGFLSGYLTPPPQEPGPQFSDSEPGGGEPTCLSGRLRF
jgi:hypothetical protein